MHSVVVECLHSSLCVELGEEVDEAVALALPGRQITHNGYAVQRAEGLEQRVQITLADSGGQVAYEQRGNAEW